MTDSLVTVHVDVAPGADVSAGVLSWPWVELGQFSYTDPSAGVVSKRRVKQASELSVSGGRQGEAAVASPGGVGLTVDNGDGAFTPGNPLGLWYPDLREGTPLRVRVPGPTVALLTDGDAANFARTPDDASLDITGSIDLRYEGEFDWWHGNGSTGVALIAKDQGPNSFLFWVTGGFPVMSWSPDGTTFPSVPATVKIPWPKGRHTLRCVFQPNNGAGGKTARFEYSDSLDGPWTLLDEVTQAGTSSIFSGSAPLDIGRASSTIRPAIGRTFGARVYAGTAGTDLRAAPDFSAQSSGTTQFTDSASRVWTLQGDSVITSDRVRRVFQISSMAPRWEQLDPLVARADIVADGVLRRLGQNEPPLQSALYRAVTSPSVASNVIAAWPMEDESGATSFASPIPGVASAGFGGEASLGSETSLAAAQGLPHVSDGDGFGWQAPVPRRTGLTQWQLNYFVLIPDPDATERTIIEVTTSGSIRRWVFSITNAALFLRAYDPNGTQVYANGTAVDPFQDGWVQLTLDLTQNGGNVDLAVAYTAIDASVFGYTDSVAGTMGLPTRIGNLAQAAGADGWAFGYAVLSTGLSTAWLGWNDGANNAYDGEKAGTRVQRLCAEEDIPVRLVGDPDNTERMGPQRADTIMNLLQDCAEADGGFLGEDPESLGLLYRTRVSMMNQSPALTLNRETRGLVDPYTPVADDRDRKTHVTVSRTAGSSATQVAANFDETTDSRYPESVTVNVESDLQLPDIAARRAHFGSSREMRLPSVATNLVISGRTPTEQAAVEARLSEWLDLHVGDLVQVVNPPGEWPPTIDLLADQITDELGTNTWVGKIDCSPAGLWTHGVRDNSDWGVRDTFGSELAAPFTAGTSTSMSVTSVTGSLWTTDAAHMPIELDVAGARLQVTAISGASSPQTFTVSATVLNGVEKTIPAGTAVNVWLPARRQAA